MQKQKGFTLIELLVVIAIIGILATIVITSLSGSKEKANQAVVKNSLAQIRSKTEVLYNQYGCYTNSENCTVDGPLEFTNDSCFGTISDINTLNSSIFGDDDIKSLISHALNTGGANFVCGVSKYGKSWVFAISYKKDDFKGWCVDSSGKSFELVLQSNNLAGLKGRVETDVNNAYCKDNDQ